MIQEVSIHYHQYQYDYHLLHFNDHFPGLAGSLAFSSSTFYGRDPLETSSSSTGRMSSLSQCQTTVGKRTDPQLWKSFIYFKPRHLAYLFNCRLLSRY